MLTDIFGNKFTHSTLPKVMNTSRWDISVYIVASYLVIWELSYLWEMEFVA